jgi:hypothetical protein
MRSLKRLLVAVSLMGAGIAGSAFAQNGPTDAQREAWRNNPKVIAMKQACAADAQKLCPNLEGRERRTCMKSHAAELSKPCTDAMAAVKAERDAVRGAAPKPN